MHSAAAPRLTIPLVLRRAAIALDFVLAAGFALLAANSLFIVGRFHPETLPRGARLLWRLSLYIPESAQFAAIAFFFVAAAVGFRRRAEWRWLAQAAALALVFFPFAIRLLLD
jgi:hypothetical protein